MAYDTTNKPALMTAAAALALYEAATMRDPGSVADAADALAAVVRANLAKLTPRAPKAADEGRRPALAAALRIAVKTLAKHIDKPILSNICLTATGDNLTVTTNDLDMVTTITVPAPGIGVWSTTVDGKDLTSLVTKGKGDVILTVEPDLGENSGRRLEVMVGNAVSGLATQPAEDYPVMAMTPAHAFTVPTADMARMLAFTRPSVSTEKNRYYLCGAYLHTVVEDGVPKLRMVSTDGHRLALDDMRVGYDFPTFNGVIVPGKALDLLASILTYGDEVKVEVCYSHIRFMVGHAQILTKVIDGVFPDYMRVVPRGNAITYKVEADAFGAAVKRVATVSREKSRSIKLTFGANVVAILCKNMQGGHAEENVPAVRDPDLVDGDAMSIGFNATYLQDAMAVLGGDHVTIALADASCPALVTGEANGRVVLMPLCV